MPKTAPWPGVRFPKNSVRAAATNGSSAITHAYWMAPEAVVVTSAATT